MHHLYVSVGYGFVGIATGLLAWALTQTMGFTATTWRIWAGFAIWIIAGFLMVRLGVKHSQKET